ncbi:hypothetical protein [Archangium lansingense]|uniref:Uncharacterized protein n=1 Tax=Archangium lansingense TaxID=2995310 RepID=A0ABT4AF48_9BACT|nr:hypothetical protein [Archangium lansinium]MCY1080307.1 hypothetical protein [Archangium lansinium]
MPTIITEKPGPCRACGGLIRKGEYADFESEKGASHVEPQCVTAPVRYRPNRRAGRCKCGARVEAGKGLLRLLEDRGAQGGGKRWAVDCARCAGL